MSTYSVKNLRFTFVLANNSVFPGTNSNTLQVSGLRATASIKGTMFPAFSEVQLAIYGMKQDDMIALTAIQQNPLGLQRNIVTVEADSGQGYVSVFSGDMVYAGPDWDAMPDVPMNVFGRVMAYDSLNPAPPSSYTGVTSVATIIQNIATKLGRAFVNNGVSAQLSNPYFPGTLAEQLRTVQAQTGIDIYNDPGSPVVVICPPGGPRDLPVFNLSPASGLVGQPKLDFNRGYVSVKAFFNPALIFGGTVVVSDSNVPTANGTWLIGPLQHDLSSLLPGGPWFTQLLLYPPGNPPPES